MSRTAEDALVAAFYARVVQRVCSDFCESDPGTNTTAAALLAEVNRLAAHCGLCSSSSYGAELPAAWCLADWLTGGGWSLEVARAH